MSRKGGLPCRRGEIWWVDLEPVRGRETGKKRPCLILQNDVGNQMGRTTIVAPIMPGHKTFPFVVNVTPTALNNTDVERHINLSQLRTVDASRIANRLGVLEAHYWPVIEQAVSIELGFSDVFG